MNKSYLQIREKTIKDLRAIRAEHNTLTSEILKDTENPRLSRQELKDRLDYYHHQSTVVGFHLLWAISSIESVVDTHGDRHE